MIKIVDSDNKVLFKVTDDSSEPEVLVDFHKDSGTPGQEDHDCKKLGCILKTKKDK